MNVMVRAVKDIALLDDGAAQGTRCRVLDTRKTVPGLRVLDKWAVKIGGGGNHRMGLFDMVMIKDNHIAAAGGIAAAIKGAEVRGGGPALVKEVICNHHGDACARQVLQTALVLDDSMR